MTTAANYNETRNGDEHPKISGQQQNQPVVSLLEKYSSLHRGIDEARKACSRRQLEIETIEGEIRRLVDVDRIANLQAIETAISEKETLLQRLETITMTDLVESQEAEFLAKSKHESIRFREEKAKRIGEDDYNQFLNASKAFREKIRTLCLRGELFGLKTPVALLSVHRALNGPVSSTIDQMTNENGKSDETSADLFFMNTNSLWEDNNIRDRVGKPENDEEIQDLLKQLHAQNETNQKHEMALVKKKDHHCSLLEANEKRAKQKKNLESQLERLQNDALDVESRIEKLTLQTREAVELTNRYRNENETQFETSNSSKLTHNSTSIQPTSQGSKVMNSTRDDSKRKSTNPYNPYARANRRKAVEDSQKTNARMISPTAATTTKSPWFHGIDDNNEGERTGDRDNRQSRTITYKTQRQSNSTRSKRRASRRFGESSFRTPRKFLGGDRGPSTTSEKSQGAGENKRSGASSMLLEDTDDEDDSWLKNARPSLRR